MGGGTHTAPAPPGARWNCETTATPRGIDFARAGITVRSVEEDQMLFVEQETIEWLAEDSEP